MGGVRVEFRGRGVCKAQHVAGELHHAHLHSKTYSQERDAVLTGILDGVDLSFQASLAESRSHQDSVHVLEIVGSVGVCYVFAEDGVYIHFAIIGGSCVYQGLLYGLVCILKGHVLAHQGNVHLF